jgi:hypothetical protein
MKKLNKPKRNMSEDEATANIFGVYNEEEMAYYAGRKRSGHICRERLACFTPSLIRPTNARPQESYTSIFAIRALLRIP